MYGNLGTLAKDALNSFRLRTRREAEKTQDRWGRPVYSPDALRTCSFCANLPDCVKVDEFENTFFKLSFPWRDWYEVFKTVYHCEAWKVKTDFSYATAAAIAAPKTTAKKTDRKPQAGTLVSVRIDPVDKERLRETFETNGATLAGRIKLFRTAMHNQSRFIPPQIGRYVTTHQEQRGY
jgi:hypothetical protein